MLAKLITHADTRDEALDRLKQALDDTSIFGITTNQGFLERLIDLPATRNATFYTRLIDDQIDHLVDKTRQPDTEALATGAYFWITRQRKPVAASPPQSRDMTGWHMAAAAEGYSRIPFSHSEDSGASAEIRF